MEVDDILRRSGDFGRYQWLLMALFCLINLLSAAHYYSQTIISVTPEHWCNVSELQNYSITNADDMIVIHKYLEGLVDSSCSRFHQEIDTIYSVDGVEANNTDYTTYTTTPCDSGWIYNYDYGYKSMIAELDWVCDDTWKSTLGQSLFFIGSVVGTLTFGVLADVVGRLPVLIMANLMALLGNGATAFSYDVIIFSVCRFITGIATDSNFVMMYIIVMEYLGPDRRTLGLNLCIGVFYCLGSAAVPWIGVALGDWKSFLIAISVPLATVPLFYFVVPESAQWLLSKGRIDDAVACFKRIAAFNKRDLDEASILEFRQTYSDIGKQQVKSSSSVLGLFKTPRLRRNTFILLFKSMVLTLCYDAISRNIDGLGYSPFVMFSASAASILPACAVLLVLQDKIGRKAMAAGALLLSGIFTASSGGLLAMHDTNDKFVTASLAVIGRFFVTIAYNSGAQYAAELIPTEVRGQGVSTVHVAGYAATFGSAYILYGAKWFKAFPSLLLGFLSITCGVMCLFLPETLGRPLPTTLADGEEFGKDERVFDFACCKSKRSEYSESEDRHASTNTLF